MLSKHDRHNHKLPIGVLLIKVALGIGGALIKKKLAQSGARKEQPKADSDSPKRSGF